MFKPSTHVAIPEDGYEKTDVKAKLIVLATIASVIATLFSIFIAFLFTIFLVSDAREYTPEGSYQGVANQASDWTDPSHLQATPETDLDTYKAHSSAKSASFGKSSDSAEVYHIPVDEALNLVAEEGALPDLKATEVAE